jgi:hypothetical protein
MVSLLFFAPIFTLTRWDEPDWPLHDRAPCDLPPRVLAALVSPEIIDSKGLASDGRAQGVKRSIILCTESLGKAGQKNLTLDTEIGQRIGRGRQSLGQEGAPSHEA